MVAQWYDSRLETRETRVQLRNLPSSWASRCHRNPSLSLVPNFATKRLSTGVNGQKKNVASSQAFVRTVDSFDRVVIAGRRIPPSDSIPKLQVFLRSPWLHWPGRGIKPEIIRLMIKLIMMGPGPRPGPST